MSKKPCFTGPEERQHGRWVEKLFQSVPLQYLLSTLNVGALGNVSLSKTQNPKTVC